MGGAERELLGDELEAQTRYRLVEALVQSERRARLRVESLNEIVFETDGALQLTFVNRSWERVLGGASPLGQSFLDFVLAGERDEVKRIFDGGGGQTTLMIPTELGDSCPMQLSVTQVDEGGFVGALFDLSERLLAQARVEALNAELEKRIEQRTQELEREVEQRRQVESELRVAQKLEAIGQLAGGLAHEINTPLQYVGNNLEFIGYAVSQLQSLAQRYQEMLEDAGAEKSARRVEAEFDFAFIREELPVAMQRTLDGTQRVQEIVRSIQDFNHPDGALPERVCLKGVVETAATMVRGQRQFACDIETDIASGLTVKGFPGALKQVLLNLLVNAAQAAREEERPQVLVKGRQEGEVVLIDVVDNGPGIAPEHMERIYDPFFTTKEVGQGTGQGLAIARRLVVEHHGGRLWCEPSPEGGTVFHIELSAGAGGAQTGGAQAWARA
jgi:signal transduction histidine kinase